MRIYGRRLPKPRGRVLATFGKVRVKAITNGTLNTESMPENATAGLPSGHSKSLRHHPAMQALFVAWYNFGRKHEALKGNTPAMASKLTDHVWTINVMISNKLLKLKRITGWAAIAAWVATIIAFFMIHGSDRDPQQWSSGLRWTVTFVAAIGISCIYLAAAIVNIVLRNISGERE